MTDPLFSDPRLVAIYDDIDGSRDDLDLYESIVDELGAVTVLDVGCGTGSLTCRLARRGIEVVGVDPAVASLDVARRKPWAEHVTWIEGDATGLPPLVVDMATMTGNVAQVFLDDQSWLATLTGIRRALRVGGHLVFETRDPAARAWEGWSRQPRRVVATDVGPVACSTEVLAVDLPFVSFRHTYELPASAEVLTSDSTLRFRTREELDESLQRTGFDVIEVRDAPDRPGLEWIYVARARLLPATSDP